MGLRASGRAVERVGVLIVAAGLPVAVAGPVQAQSDPLAEPFPAVLQVSDLDGLIGFRIDSVVDSDRMGFSVGTLGDFNGDGVDDVIIGAPRANPGGTEPSGGEAYIVFGSATGFPAIFDAAGLDGINGLVLQGAMGPFDSGEHAGISVAGAGDLNGDGVADAVIGAERAGVDRLGMVAGKAYVVFGRSDGVFDPVVRLADVDGQSGFAVLGIDPGDLNGSAVSSAGDTNGDGFEDVLIGARGGGEGGGYAPYYYCCPGEAYIIYGRDVTAGASFPPAYEFGPGGLSEGFTIQGDVETDNVGQAVSSAGDINGDGLDDVIVGAPEIDRYLSENHVVFGRPTADAGPINVRDLDGTNGFSMGSSIAPGSPFFDASVDSAGDVNGDGLDDLIVNSFFDTASVVFGRAGDFPAQLRLNDLDGTEGFRLAGRFNTDVAGIGDLNGDGIDDIALGNRYDTADGSDFAGSVYIVFGTRDGFPAEVDLLTLDGTNGFRIDGVESGDGIGHAISPAGDINSDGNPDLLIGKVNPLTGDSAVGAYVVFGRDSDCPADLDSDGRLTLFDFLEFQTLFDAMDPRADFDGDGDFTVFDFLEFQNVFDAGC